jgi:hypothetical protein
MAGTSYVRYRAPWKPQTAPAAHLHRPSCAFYVLGLLVQQQQVRHAAWGTKKHSLLDHPVAVAAALGECTLLPGGGEE